MHAKTAGCGRVWINAVSGGVYPSSYLHPQCVICQSDSVSWEKGTFVPTNFSSNTQTPVSAIGRPICPTHPSDTLPVLAGWSIEPFLSFIHSAVKTSAQSLPGNLWLSLSSTRPLTHNFPLFPYISRQRQELWHDLADVCIHVCLSVWVCVRIWLWQMSQAQLNGLWLGHIGF